MDQNSFVVRSNVGGLLSVLRTHVLICGLGPMPSPMSYMICAPVICGLSGQGGKVYVGGSLCWMLEDVGCFMCLVSCKRYYLGREISSSCWRYVLEESHYLLRGLTFLSYTLNYISKIQSSSRSFFCGAVHGHC